MRFKQFMKTQTSLAIIIAAALLLELTTGVMYYAAQNIVQKMVELLVVREMDGITLSIRNQLAKVEITLDNMSWVVTDDLEDPDSLFKITYKLVEHNPDILGSSISCIPYLYPQRGRWFEPYAVHRSNGMIETMQLGSEKHDYTKAEFFIEPIARGTGYWCEPYMDQDGAKAMVTSYGVPVRDKKGKIVAVVDADLSLNWLDGVMNEGKIYPSTQRFLLTGKNNLLAGNNDALFRSTLEQIKTKSEADGYFTQDNKQGMKHVFYTPVGGKTDWMLICVLDDGEVFGYLRHVRLFLLLMILSGFLLLGFIVWRTSRNLERLRKVDAEKKRISAELLVAHKIQQSMLPNNYLKLDDVEVFGSLVPAREVGGDLFDYFVRNEKLFFCIGDVSGKGTPSAMLMASTRSLFRAFSTRENSPARIMQNVNEVACQDNTSCMFVTMFIGVLDLPTGHLRYCNAGHDRPFIKIKSQQSMLEAEANLPVGLFNNVNYVVQETWLQPNSTIFLYTDGLTEAMNSLRQQYTLEQVEMVLSKCIDKHPKDLLDTVSESVHQFVGNAEQSDDLTMLAIHYMPQRFNELYSETLTLKNDIREVTKLSSFQKSFFEKMNIEKSLARQLRLAIEEAVVNVIEYAYPVATEGIIELRMMSDGHRLKVMLIDSGIPFDPTTLEKVDITLSAEERQVGGLGIHLVRELMDSVNYDRTDGQNTLTLIKQLNK